MSKQQQLDQVIRWVLNNCRLNHMEEDFLVNDIGYDYDSIENAIAYMQDIVTHGCISGVVPYLIYHAEIMGYLSEFSLEIDELLQEMLEMDVFIKYNGMEYMVFTAFEYMVNKMLWYFEGAIQDLELF